ncbi:unnamed protein product [Arabidopsis halleri]
MKEPMLNGYVAQELCVSNKSRCIKKLIDSVSVSVSVPVPE